MRFSLSISKGGDAIATIGIPSAGLTVGSETPGDVVLPKIQERFRLILTPAGRDLAFRLADAATAELDGTRCTTGLLCAGSECCVGGYCFSARFERDSTDQISGDSRQPTATVRFDSGSGVLEVTTGRIQVISSEDQTKSVPLDADVLVIGTEPGCDILLTDRFVSGRHAVLTRKPDGYHLRDLESTNGTFINDARIVEARIEPECEFRVGQTDLKLLLKIDQVEVQPVAEASFHGLVGGSEKMRQIFGLIQKVAPTKAAVLIEGETGTGKELAARALHARSNRSAGPFMALNCGALPLELIESELFGHVRGAFSGAHAQHRGVFELADAGTLFLDEISDLPTLLQPALLRVLEQGTFRKVGGEQEHAVDVRVVAATNKNLRTLVDRGAFRADLYFRLAMMTIALPPLRERGDDVMKLAAHFLEQERELLGLDAAPHLTERARQWMASYAWPGNVRELRNILRRALIVAEPGEPLGKSALIDGEGTTPEPADATLQGAERQAIIQALKTSATRREAAKRLGIAVSTLYEKLKRYGIDPKAKTNPSD